MVCTLLLQSFDVKSSMILQLSWRYDMLARAGMFQSYTESDLQNIDCGKLLHKFAVTVSFVQRHEYLFVMIVFA